MSLTMTYSQGKGHPITGYQVTRGGVEVQLYLFSTSALGRGGWSVPHSGRFTPGKDPVPIVQEAEWAPGPVWTCAKNLAATGIFFFFLLVSCTLLVWNCSGIRRKTERLRAVDFSIMKNPTASVGSEPAILGSRGQHATP
jgi:hypothetical protein